MHFNILSKYYLAPTAALFQGVGFPGSESHPTLQEVVVLPLNMLQSLNGHYWVLPQTHNSQFVRLITLNPSGAIVSYMRRDNVRTLLKFLTYFHPTFRGISQFLALIFQLVSKLGVRSSITALSNQLRPNRAHYLESSDKTVCRLSYFNRRDDVVSVIYRNRYGVVLGSMLNLQTGRYAEPVPEINVHLDYAFAGRTNYRLGRYSFLNEGIRS